MLRLGRRLWDWCGMSRSPRSRYVTRIPICMTAVLMQMQFVAITALLAFSAHHESPTKPGVSEWDACERPLGVWDSIWLVRVALGAVLSVWGFKRDRAIRLAYVTSYLPMSSKLRGIWTAISLLTHPVSQCGAAATRNNRQH